MQASTVLLTATIQWLHPSYRPTDPWDQMDFLYSSPSQHRHRPSTIPVLQVDLKTVRTIPLVKVSNISHLDVYRLTILRGSVNRAFHVPQQLFCAITTPSSSSGYARTEAKGTSQ